MRQVSRSALVAQPAARMYALINDIERYPEFIPWCTHAVVRERTATEIVASLTVKRGPAARAVHYPQHPRAGARHPHAAGGGPVPRAARRVDPHAHRGTRSCAARHGRARHGGRERGGPRSPAVAWRWRCASSSRTVSPRDSSNRCSRRRRARSWMPSSRARGRWSDWQAAAPLAALLSRWGVTADWWAVASRGWVPVAAARRQACRARCARRCRSRSTP